MFRGFIKYLFGMHYEKGLKGVGICLLVYLGLLKSGISVPIAPAILYLMMGTVTGGSVWQDLSGKNQMLAGRNLFMLPFSGWRLTASYVGALGSYTLVTRTGMLLAVVLAVSPRGTEELTGCLLCACYSILAAAWIYGEREHQKLVLLWNGSIILLALWLSDTWLFHVLLTANSLAGVFFLRKVDAYAFYEGERSHFRVLCGLPIFPNHKRGKGILIWRYFFRYLWFHKNYLINLLILWGVAAGLPLCFGQIERDFALPISCALLTLNTPVCILLSADPDLEQAVRTLPGQKISFLLPYGGFLFICNLIADVIFLCSFWIQRGLENIGDIGLALVFAGLGAAGSVLMEWQFPIRGWKTQSDLWHHPRKYVVPGSLLLLSGFLGTLRFLFL